MSRFFVFIILVFSHHLLSAQDTFSIVAVDPNTGEVGSAGASCVDLFQFPGLVPDFLATLIPGEGAINTQAFWNGTNQNNALLRFEAGDSPTEIIDWLIQNDISNQPSIRQYGIIRMLDGVTEGAAHTGSAAPMPAAQIIGDDFVVVANFMATESMADSMALAFTNANGNLSCKLLAALQAGKRQGGDSRCTPSGISSLFAFVKTTTPNANMGSPDFLVSVQTRQNDGVDAIDSLQILHDHINNCQPITTTINPTEAIKLSIFPNPTTNLLSVNSPSSLWGTLVQLLDATGSILKEITLQQNLSIDLSDLPKGIYFLTSQRFRIHEKIIVLG